MVERMELHHAQVVRIWKAHGLECSASSFSTVPRRREAPGGGGTLGARAGLEPKRGRGWHSLRPKFASDLQ